MSSSPSTPSRCCPQCGAEMLPGRSKCSICHAEIPSLDANLSASGLAGPGGCATKPVSTTDGGLVSPLLLVALIGFLGGLCIMSPGLGIAAAVLTLPVLLRASVVALGRPDRDAPLSAGRKVTVILLTIVMGVVVIVAAGAAFVFTCTATVDQSQSLSGLGVGVLFGGMAGLAVAGTLTWFYWKISRGKLHG
jgi:hypothetical protein